MTFTAIPSAADPRNLVQNASSLIQWRSNVGNVGRLGCAFPTASCFVFSNIGFDDSQQTAFFRIGVPVSLKNTGGKKALLYICIEPEQISNLQRLPLDDSEATQLGLNALVAHSKECSSPNDVIALQFLLKQHVTIVGLNGVTTLTPKSDAAGKILESLHSLSLVTNITVYFPSTETLAKHINELCRNAQGGRLLTPKKLPLDTLFGGAGGVDVSGLLARFGADNSQEMEANLPSYHELLSTPESTSSRPQKRRLSSSNLTPPRQCRQLRAKNVQESTLELPTVANHEHKPVSTIDPPLPRYERTPSISPIELHIANDDPPPAVEDVSAADGNNLLGLNVRYGAEREGVSKIYGENGEEEEQHRVESEKESAKRKRKAISTVESQTMSPSSFTGVRAEQRAQRKRVRFHIGEGSSQRQKQVTTSQTRSSRHFSTPDSLCADLADFIEWLLCVDVTLRKKYDNQIWRLGDAAAAGNGAEFHRLVAECQAEVVTHYRRRTKDDV